MNTSSIFRPTSNRASAGNDQSFIFRDGAVRFRHGSPHPSHAATARGPFRQEPTGPTNPMSSAEYQALMQHGQILSPVIDKKDSDDNDDEIVIEDVLSPETLLQRRYHAAKTQGLVIEIADSLDENDENKTAATATNNPAAAKGDYSADQKGPPPRPRRNRHLAKNANSRTKAAAAATHQEPPASPTTLLAGTFYRLGLRRSARLNKSSK